MSLKVHVQLTVLWAVIAVGLIWGFEIHRITGDGLRLFWYRMCTGVFQWTRLTMGSRSRCSSARSWSLRPLRLTLVLFLDETSLIISEKRQHSTRGLVQEQRRTLTPWGLSVSWRWIPLAEFAAWACGSAQRCATLTLGAAVTNSRAKSDWPAWAWLTKADIRRL